LLEFRRISENLINQESELHPALATINSFKISLGKINKKTLVISVKIVNRTF
jgi:hypothetical protein